MQKKSDSWIIFLFTNQYTLQLCEAALKSFQIKIDMENWFNF